MNDLICKALPLCAVILVVSITPVTAVEPSVWSFSTRSDFVLGDLKGVAVTSDGKLIPAPSFETILDTGEAFIFSAAADRNGQVFVGTGNNGRIFRIASNGSGAEWSKLDESGVFALAVDSGNRVYAGTSPDGNVYRLDNQGTAQVFFEPGEKFIWALAVDRQDNLYVATGPRGLIYRVTPQGQSATFYDTKSTHVVSLGWDLDGNLLAGTSPGAQLFRITPAGRGTVLFDSPLEELKAIATDRYGTIYAAALAGLPTPGEGATPTPTSSPASSALRAPQAAERISSQEQTIRVSGNQSGRRLEVYRINRDNLVEILYSADEELAFDLSVRDDSSLLVATGNRGRILSINPNRRVTFLAQSEEEQVTRLVQTSAGVYATTSNLGKVYRLLPQPSREAIYESKVLDAKVMASWGHLRWYLSQPSEASVRMHTRSGNTSSPDHTWEDWKGPYTVSTGSRIESSPARYLQWKLEFGSEGRSNALISDRQSIDLVTIHYQQRNMAPVLTSVTIHPPGVAFTRFPTAAPSGGVTPGGPDGAHLRSLPRSVRNIDRSITPPPPRKIYVPGGQSISWSAEDPNDDDLVYALYLRRQDETSWRRIATDLTETDYTIDGMSLPEGTYFARVVVSDRPSNPPDRALEAELISPAFVISNASPSIEASSPEVQGNQVSIRFTARATASTIFRAEYSINADEWVLMYPVDGIADSSVEEYLLAATDVPSGEHSFDIRVIDSVGNIGTARTRVRVP